jgi:hypothetical protein
MENALQEAVDKIRRRPAAEVLSLYQELRAQAPEQAHVVALALRHMARAGELPVTAVPTLHTALEEAPDPSCVLHLAKTLAAYGRDAQVAATTLARKIDAMHVTDDIGYWVFEGAVFSLMFLGGPVAAQCLDRIAREAPPRPLKSDAVFAGSMPRGRREKRFEMMLQDGKALLAEANPRWTSKRTRLKADPNARPPPPRKAWNVR